jgi:hypothetical protein
MQLIVMPSGIELLSLDRLGDIGVELQVQRLVEIFLLRDRLRGGTG